MKFIKDARWFQLVFLLSFLIYGKFSLDWETPIEFYFVTILTGIFIQYFFIRIKKLPKNSIISGIISSLGICLLFKSNDINWYFAATATAICSKFLIQHNGKHFFNPVNFTLIVSVLISNNTWISPGQWGNAGFLIFLFGSAGMVVLVRVKRFYTMLSFLGTLFILQFCLIVLYEHWPLDHLYHTFFNGTLMLFSFFMITDPRTIPNHPKVRIVWSMTIAVISFYLINWHYLYSAPLWVLFFASFLTPVINTIFKYETFKWNQYEKVNA